MGLDLWGKLLHRRASLSQKEAMTRKTGLIAPSLAAANLGRIEEEVRAISAAGSDLIHIDIMDGVFVPNITFGPWILDVVRKVSSLPLDCHLMVSRPADWIPILAAAGAHTITVHIESTPHIHRVIETIKSLGKKAGVSFNPGHPVCLMEELADWADVIQVMTVDPGFSGQKFIEASLKKVSHLRDVRGARNFIIEVDGGISSENISSIRDAGADIFVLGSFIFSHPDKNRAIENLKAKVR
jgi:ribulose-phosphate 3-epimerase